MRFALVMVVLLAGCNDRKKGEATKPAPTPIVQPVPAIRDAPARDAPTCAAHEATTCAESHVVDCKTGGTLRVCDGGCRAGACIDTCAAHDMESIYVVDDAENFLSFDPKAATYHVIGKLNCEASSTPNSMAVDRNGIAWVSYHDGKLFRVSLFDARCVGSTTVEGGARTYGMGFVSDGPKSDKETLFVAATADGAFARIELAPGSATWKAIGSIASKPSEPPEFTGTGDGELFAYLPAPGRGFVQEVDRTTGKFVGTRWTLPSEAKAHVEAWAFAHWGGVFYVFATVDGKGEVHAVHRKTGEIERVLADQPYRVVGAGVSTCAPLLEAAP